ncbi:MAG: glycosyltransferase family 2 protein [Deltaproteobacteria bacterium]|nr:glycosyltransferase family 2 protein [Deltaproteobacteria bacterium]
MAGVFWVSVFLLLHTYVLYPLALVLLDALEQARANLRFIGGGADRRGLARAPPGLKVTLVVAAYNEESCIDEKLRNSLQLAWPAADLEVLVGSDGSTDGTDAKVEAVHDPRVRLSAAPRGGKVAVLNRCIPLAKGEVVVLTDANTMLDPAALEKLARHFRDPDVGAVCGRLRLYNPTLKAYEESAYWTYESFIKFYEGKHGAVLGANGGLYAIRRSLFQALPPDTVVDDFVIPMRILQSGFRVLYDPEAVAYEETTEDYVKEASRRARIAAGNFQSLRLLGRLLMPRAGFASFAFWSHKLLRWTAPLWLALALLTNLTLLGHRWGKLALAMQLGFYALAVAGRQKWVKRGALRRVASVAYYFTSMNLALAVGFGRFVAQSQAATWDRTERART